MNKYNERSRCVKCGNPQARSQFLTRHELGEISRQEFIQRKCTNCGYEWKELPIDAEEQTM